MSQPFVGEIRMFGGSFAPAGWAFCSGQIMPISENDTLFNLIGTTYGGDGQETFGLPDLQGRIPIHAGQGSGLSPYILGEKAGTENVTLTTQQLPNHSHTVLASADPASSTQAAGNITAATNQLKIYTENATSKVFAPNTLSVVGGSQPHENMMPFLVITFIISLFGIFPTQN
jgi:microcystin-dependent protein